MVPVDSDGISRAPPYSGNPPGVRSFSPTGPLPSVAGLSSPLRLKICFVTPWRSTATPGDSYNTRRATPVGYHTLRVWALPFSLAATGGIAVAFFSSGYLDVSVHPLAFLALCVQARMTRLYPCRVSPFGHLRICVCSATTRSFSQPAASFFGSYRQGIHRMLLAS